MNYLTNYKHNLRTIIKLIAVLCIVISLFPTNINTQACYIESPIKSSNIEPLAFDLNANYAALMQEAAEAGDVELGREYERLRNLKKAYLGIVDELTFDDIYNEVNTLRSKYWWGIKTHTLTASERDLVERIVAAEARGTSYECMVAVAQTIRERSEHWGQSIKEVVKYPQYTYPYRGTISKEVKNAVSDVFDHGVRVFDEYTTHFHTDYVNPWWNKSKVFRGKIDNVLFWGVDNP